MDFIKFTQEIVNEDNDIMYLSGYQFRQLAHILKNRIFDDVYLMPLLNQIIETNFDKDLVKIRYVDLEGKEVPLSKIKEMIEKMPS